MSSDYTDKYNTPIPPEKQAAFNSWVQSKKQATGKNPLGDRYDYDVNGYWLSGAANDPRGHGPDTFKKPNHPTFSDESIYNGVNGNYGGHWGDDNTYSPSPTNLQHRSMGELQDYFKQVEPDVKLKQPKIDSIGNAGAPPDSNMSLPSVFSSLLGFK